MGLIYRPSSNKVIKYKIGHGPNNMMLNIKMAKYLFLVMTI